MRSWSNRSRSTLEVTRAERLGGEARGNDLGLVQINGELNAVGSLHVRAMRKQRTVGAEPAQKPSSMPPVCKASVAARTSAKTGWTPSAKSTGLPGVGDDLRVNAAGGSKERALTAVTTVDPRREGRKVDADGPQDG